MGISGIGDPLVKASGGQRGRPRKSELEKTIDGYYRNLSRLEDKALKRINRALTFTLDSLDKEIAKIDAKISGAASGADLDSLFFQRSRLGAMQLQARESLTLFGSEVAKAVETVQTNATAFGQRAIERLADRTVLDAAGFQAGFNLLPQSALNELVGTLSDGSPVASLAQSFGDMGATAFSEEMVKGIALGLNPRQVAGNWRQRIAGVSRAKAETITRTEMMRSFRESSRKTMEANSDIIKEWQWYCSLEARTCPVCWSMHGRKFPLKTKMATHPNCRCTMLPVTKSFEELGIPGVRVPTEDRRLTTPGDVLFMELPAADKIKVLGPAGYRAYEAGALDLEDYVGEAWSPVWGATRYQKSLSSILGREQAKQYYKKSPPTGGTIPPAPKPLPIKSGEEWVNEARAKIAGGLATEAEVRELGAIIREQMVKSSSADARALQIRLAEKDKEFADLTEKLYGDSADWSHPDRQKWRDDKNRLQQERFALQDEIAAYGPYGKTNVVNHLKKVRPGYGEGSTQNWKLHGGSGYSSQDLDDYSLMKDVSDRLPKEWVEDYAKVPIKPKHTARGQFYAGRDFPGYPDPHVEIQISGSNRLDSMATAIHELGHYAEYMRPGIRVAEQQFYARRTAGERLRSLKTLFPNSNYRRDEKTRIDQFIAPYMGKEYLDNPRTGYNMYELTTMGAEFLLSDRPRYDFTPDTDFIDFILGILAGK